MPITIAWKVLIARTVPASMAPVTAERCFLSHPCSGSTVTEQGTSRRTLSNAKVSVFSTMTRYAADRHECRLDAPGFPTSIVAVHASGASPRLGPIGS